MLDHIQARTHHFRRGGIHNAFTYGVDYVVTDLAPQAPVRLLSRNKRNLWSLWDIRHGGPRDHGEGAPWFENVLRAQGFEEAGFDLAQTHLVLMTQPSFLWFHFNPVSFWVALVEDQPRAFVAEVNSTFGQRHCYFCAHDDFAPIAFEDTLRARKLMHVSPFQKIEGAYKFNFGFTPAQINIRILYENGDEGVLATLSGPRRPATDRSLLWAALRRPFGSARVVALIHWQALKLFFKRAPFLKRQPPPQTLLSKGHAPKTHSSQTRKESTNDPI